MRDHKYTYAKVGGTEWVVYEDGAGFARCGHGAGGQVVAMQIAYCMNTMTTLREMFSVEGMLDKIQEMESE